jgi:methylenetetrahydrofolate dehydrogenase (NADP+)/methenyltetrahydrofolate cyclohydrolase
MLIDGRALARDIFKEMQNVLTHSRVRPHLTVFTCAPNFETQKFLALKKRKADEVGIGLTVIEFPETITTDEVVASVTAAAMQTDSIIVQLPFPASIDIDRVLAAIPEGCDADAVHYTGGDARILPPVVGAIAAMATQHGVAILGKHVVVVGQGRLVGKPAAMWARSEGAQVTVVTREKNDLKGAVQQADILILGAGSPGLITPDMVKRDVVIFDAGTSESDGALVGDADPACAARALFQTPVPGGIGPVTVAILLQNVMRLALRA